MNIKINYCFDCNEVVMLKTDGLAEKSWGKGLSFHMVCKACGSSDIIKTTENGLALARERMAIATRFLDYAVARYKTDAIQNHVSKFVWDRLEKVKVQAKVEARFS